jgi:hypothetical protein
MRLRVVACLLLFAGCAPDIPQNPKPQVVVAQFDPLAVPPVLPLPNDLAKDPNTGLLAIPDNPGASPAQKEFNAYLRTLDGFPTSTPVTATFSDAVDPKTALATSVANPGSVAVFDLSAMAVLGPSDYTVKISTDGKTMTLVPTKTPWKLGHTYVALAFGGSDPHGLKPMSSTNTAVVAAPFTFFLRSSLPLLSKCADLTDPMCACPQDKATGAFDSSCTPALGLSFDQASLLEGPRQQVDQSWGLLSAVVGGQRNRDDLVFIWNFTFATGPFAVFDPTIPKVPFPNDVLINQTTGKVSLPIDPNAPAAMQAIYTGLNKLDGFSTTADATCPIDTADGLAPVGGMAMSSVFMIDTTDGTNPKVIDVAIAAELENGKDYDGLYKVTPVRPLSPDLHEHVVVLTNGITDSKMRPLRPSPVMQFVKSQSPLFDTSTMHSTVDQLADADAMQLEGLRTAYIKAGLWTALAGDPFHVKQDDVAMVWTFKTQSMTQDLQSLAALPGTKMFPTDVTILDAEPGSTLGPDVGQIVWGKMHTHLALGADGTLDLVVGKDVDIPFLMTLPKNPPQSGAPVVIVQHGLGRWRGDALAISEAFASQGWATIAIDINGHGGRSSCTADADCANSGTCNKMTGACSTALKVNCNADADCTNGGTCDKMSGACSTMLAPNSGTCLTHLENSAPVTECNPAASGNAFLNFTNPFALRDNFRQHVLDLNQVVRLIADATPNGVVAKIAALQQPVKLDPTKTAYIGQSLGGIEGTLFLSVSASPTVGVLNVPGGRLTDILTTSPTFMPLVAGLIQGFGVTADTAAYYQLLNTLRWIVDPGDPINFGRHVKALPLNGNGKKIVIVQEAGNDMVIPNPWTDALTTEIGLPLLDAGTHPGVTATLITDQASGPQKVSTTFPGASHGFIFAPGVGTVTGQTQAVTWIASGGQLISAP